MLTWLLVAGLAHAADDALRTTVQAANAEANTLVNDGRFAEALEVALEDIVRPALPRIAKVSYK